MYGHPGRVNGCVCCACRCVRALHSTGTDNIEQAVSWIVEHEEDPDLDKPLLIPQVSIAALVKHGSLCDRMLLILFWTWALIRKHACAEGEQRGQAQAVPRGGTQGSRGSPPQSKREARGLNAWQISRTTIASSESSCLKEPSTMCDVVHECLQRWSKTVLIELPLCPA